MMHAATAAAGAPGLDKANRKALETLETLPM